METPWWYLIDKDIDLDDELNIVKTVDYNEDENDDVVQPVEQEITASTVNNEIENNDVVQSIEDEN